MSQEKLAKNIEERLGLRIAVASIPPQGMDSQVFFIQDENKNEYAVKVTNRSTQEDIVYKLLNDKKVDVAYPRLFADFEFNGKCVLILEKIEYPLLDSIPHKNLYRYIPSMINEQKKIHKIKSQYSGLIDTSRSWANILCSTFENSRVDWDEVSRRKGIDGKLLKESIKNFTTKVRAFSFLEKNFALLHTDFNQRNLFVDPNSNKITGIIDWAEAIFGDPIYDFARIRMFIWHFNLGKKVEENYYKIMSYTDHEVDLENLYWLSRVIEYLEAYSEELNKFNVGRMKLHQDFLKNYKWEII